MTQLTREERFRRAADAEGGMPVSAGPRVGHLRTAEEGGRFLRIDLLSVAESKRPALIAQITKLVAGAVAASAVEEPASSRAPAVGRTTQDVAWYKAAVKRLEGKLGPDSPAGGDDILPAFRFRPRGGSEIWLGWDALEWMELGFVPDCPVGADATLPAYFLPKDVLEIRLGGAALEGTEGETRPGSPDIPAHDNDLALGYIYAPNAAEALKFYKEMLDRMEGKVGPDSTAKSPST